MSRIGAAWLWLALATGISGCALLTPPGEPSSAPAWDQRHAELSRLEHWVLQARIASSRIGWTGNLHWRQNADHFEIRVSGPLGAGGFQARGHLGEVEIRTARETVVTQAPEALLEESIGWSLPLRQLRYWALGLPSPDSPARLVFDGLGRLQSLEQDGWRLEYREYGAHGTLDLPRRFTLDNGDTSFRVVVDEWREVG